LSFAVFVLPLPLVELEVPEPDEPVELEELLVDVPEVEVPEVEEPDEAEALDGVTTTV
jgi:hypothetical protein